MIVLGLTGGMATGKSTITKYLQSKDIWVWDYDQAVADLYEKSDSGIWYLHSREFKEIIGYKSKREVKDVLRTVPSAIHIIARAAEPFLKIQANTFIKDAKLAKRDIVVIDMPMLFEARWHKTMPIAGTIATSCPFSVQYERIYDRSIHTMNDVGPMIASQLTDEERREKATFIINTNCDLQDTYNQVDAALLLAKNLRLLS